MELAAAPNASSADYTDYYRYPWILPFESGPELKALSYWLAGSWRLSLYVVPIYFAIVVVLQRWMRLQPPIRATDTLFAWNVVLSVISFVAVIRLFPEIVHAVRQHGLCDSLLCVAPVFGPDGSVTLFWAVIFAWCKLFELGDTVFLVLRKKRVTLLHGFHHASTLIGSWYGGEAPELIGLFRWIMAVNFFVHFWMYGYFALKTRGTQLHRYVPRSITLLQIAQIVFILYLHRHLHYLLGAGLIHTEEKLFVGFMPLLGAANLSLFLNYYYHAYIHKPKGKTD